ncbi:hypothetical protein BGZ80_011760 [Entomortierella chlamydospora]|uniref:Protein kinase domain-containing protein n=1 Tax=Entomortierella chlamydospora TaxID=101097 RepID=A0A9P6MT33_9FUNG|nr:hypothetical protein BGZ80_011760 [Entomortierella chlamydospora]
MTIEHDPYSNTANADQNMDLDPASFDTTSTTTPHDSHHPISTTASSAVSIPDTSKCPNATWFHRPKVQPSSISTTATSSLMSSTSLIKTNHGTAEGSPTPIAMLPAKTRAPATLYASLQSALAAGTVVGPAPRLRQHNHNSPTTQSDRTMGPYSSQLPASIGTLHVNPLPQLPVDNEPTHHNPYRPPSHTNCRAFVPPRVPGYEFIGGSQAGNMGLMMGRRISDGVLVTGKLHQIRTLLQHEYRILKRLKITNAKYIPDGPFPRQFNANNQEEARRVVESDCSTEPTKDKETSHRECRPKPGAKKVFYEAGGVETEKYFNRVVEDFIDLEQEDMSILILERLGHNLLSHTHHPFLGLEGIEGLNNSEIQKLNLGSPFPDVYTFLIFALKAASILEALMSANLAHLAICPTALHWAPPRTDVETSNSGDGSKVDSNASKPPNHALYPPLKDIDINNTTLRLFDFTHSKILSHERARAPNNIAEWQIPGYLEYHLQFLAPEQTGRAETWMDHRTDIYGLGATLFALLTMQFPNTGNDSVQILQGVLSRDLPPVRDFRPDMPSIVDDILRKMTQKQPSRRYQSAFGLKQDILQCLNMLKKSGQIDSFELGKHDISYQFVLPNAIFGRNMEHKMISAAIAQAASAYQQSLNAQMLDGDDDVEDGATQTPTKNNADYYIFEDDIVSLQSQASSKIPLSSKTLLRTPKPFNGVQSVHRGPETTDPIVRVVFVSGASGVGKTFLIRGMAPVARNSGLFAAGAFDAEGSAPYSAILSCIQSVLQQLLAQHTDALASLFVAIRTAFEPSSGIGVICDLVPELRYFFGGSEMPESKDVPLAHSITRFHFLILKLIRVISTHFFMTWLIDDLQFADENSIDLLATLVNVNKRLPIVLIITHRDTPDCLMKVRHILGGGNTVGSQQPSGLGALGAVHHDRLMDDLSAKGGMSSRPMSKSSALRGTGDSLVVRGGGGVRFIRLQNPTTDSIQEFLVALLHREKADVAPLAKVLSQKSWLTIRQLVLELYRNQTIYFDCGTREWAWESCPDTLAETVRKLTGEEYSFLDNRFRALDCNTKRALVCASVCGPSFTIQDLQQLITETYSWTIAKSKNCDTAKIETTASEAAPEAAPTVEAIPATDAAPAAEALVTSTDSHPNFNRGCDAMAGIQCAIREGILIYTSVTDHLRFHHGIMRKVAMDLLENPEDMERLHFDITKLLFNTPGQEFRIAGHVLQCLKLIKKRMAMGARTSDDLHDELMKTNRSHAEEQWQWSDSEIRKTVEIDTRSFRRNLSLAGEKSQKSGAQDMSLAYWSAALSLLPGNCWDQPPERTNDAVDNDISRNYPTSFPQSPAAFNENLLYREALKLHLQCIEAERWCENFDQAMKICDVVLSKVNDPIDRARVYQHQIEMYVWAYSSPDKAMATTIQCLHELGLSKDFDFNPSEDEIRDMFDKTHLMLMEHIPILEANPPKLCTDPNVAMMMEVLQVSSASLYYCSIPFISCGIVQSMRLTCEHGITKDSGRALVSFALTYSTWFNRLDHAYEYGKLACAISNDNHHVKFLFYVAVQQWGEHVAASIPALEETLTAVDLTCDRLFHTAGMIHVSVMKVLVARVPLNDLMTTTIELLTKHIEFGPKSHGVEVMQGILQMIKCLMGRTMASDPETIFDDVDLSDIKNPTNGQSSSNKKVLTLVHNDSTYQMLKALAAFIFGHYAYVQEVTDAWHDDPKSIMNFEGSWITHAVFTIVGLSLANILRTETDPEVRKKHKRRLFKIRSQMEVCAHTFPTNHAAMYYLLEAEMADQGLTPESNENGETAGVEGVDGPIIDKMKVLLLYEKAIEYSVDGDFPLHKCFSYELAAKAHLRYGLLTSSKHMMTNACKVYQTWGAKGKVQWLHNTYAELFPAQPEADATAVKRRLFYRPSDSGYSTNRSLSTAGPNNSGATSSGSGGSATSNSPWMAGSPKSIYSPTTFGPDAVSAAAAAMVGSNMASSFQSGCPSATSTSSSILTAPLYSLQNTWLSSPQTPEMDNADLDVLDFSSVIEAMQVIASEIDLDLLLVKSLGVLNQSVGAKRCCIIISKDHELVLSASLGDSGRCESVNPPMEISQCSSLFHGVINYVVNTSAPCLLTNAKDDPRFCADEYLSKQRVDLKTLLCAPIIHKAALVGVLYMEDFPERAFANKRMLVMNLLVQQLGISITNALLYQSVLQSETKSTGLLENMPCGISLWDASGNNCLYVNSTWEDMTGFTREEIMSSETSILAHPDELVSEGLAWKERVQEGVPCQWECRYSLKDGTYRWGIVRMLPIMANTDNRILQWVTVTIDIDDQRKAVQLKSNFLANMSHELRTPFSGILGMLSLLGDSSGLTHEQFEFVDMAKASCEMLIRIVDDLLNFSKLEADKVTLEYIPMCFEEIIGVPLASRKGLELIILPDVNLPILLVGDPDRMKQILMNLIGNAIKFSTSGNVVIKYWHETRKRESIPSKKAILASKGHFDKFLSKMEIDLGDESLLGDEVVLHCSVTDEGIGMTPEEQKMLFVSFQQTDSGTTRKYGGTGLGLSICAQLINHMHGKVVVESEKGKGSTFTFTAKLNTSTDHDYEQNPVESKRIKDCGDAINIRGEALRSKRVLILSPNKSLREQIMITVLGAECMEFDGVESAVQSGAIGILGDPTGCCCSDIIREGIVDSNVDFAESKNGGYSCCQGSSPSRLHPEGTIRQFDFILVDHVLDSKELDCIYPSPSIAFVLLLAPTTETLRWILPPAQKISDPMDSDETDSSQVDVGGRGRIQKISEVGFAGNIIGQVRSSSYLSKIRVQPSKSDGVTDLEADASSGSHSRTSSGSRPKRLMRIPSELFKRKKNSIRTTNGVKKKRMSETLAKSTKTMVHGYSTSKTPGLMTANTGAAACNAPPCSSFQVCRMIKPVRRLKLLQILYNALLHHEQKLSGEGNDDDDGHANLVELSEESEIEDGDGGASLQRSRSQSEATDGTASPLSSPPARVSLKRKISREPLAEPLEDRTDDDEVQSSSSSSGANSSVGSPRDEELLKNRRHADKTAKLHALSSVAHSSPSSSSKVKGNSANRRTIDNNLPKRARNNDALTLLLTHEERKRCRGINVLVAEDDYVSQKILEKQLSKLGMNVMIASNGQEAVEQWLAVERGHYTIAIFDHHMPIMDGLAATKKIRSLEEEQRKNSAVEGDESNNAESSDGNSNRPMQIRIPIVGLSADIQLATKEKCIKAGMDEYMTKPLLKKTLAIGMSKR